MNLKELLEYHDYLVDLGINEDVLNCLEAINGFNEETINSVTYYYFGYRDFQQLKEAVENGN